MNAQQIQTILSCIADNGISPQDICGYLSEIRIGDYHFTNGEHFPVLIPGLVADGVFISPEYYITDKERDDSTSYARAKRFCSNRDTVLPDIQARNNMERESDRINDALKKINFPKLAFGIYWAENDPDQGMHKHVRGCIRVTPKASKIPPCLIETFVARNVYGRLLSELGCSAYGFETYCNNWNYYPQAGQYLLKNGSVSSTTVFNQENGIFVNPNLYLSLEMPQSPLTAEQTKVYCKAYNVRIPEYFELRQIEKEAEKLNQALSAVGMDSFKLPENILTNCWCQEGMEKSLENEDTTPRRVLLVGKQNNVPDLYIVIQDILSHIKYC